jgi:hypothetical protein
MGVAYDCGIKVLHNGCDLRLDLVGYSPCGSAFRPGSALGSALLGLMALCLFWALYLHQFSPMKYDGMFLRGRVREIHFLLLAHRLQFSDGSFREIGLMSTIALKG